MAISMKKYNAGGAGGRSRSILRASTLAVAVLLLGSIMVVHDMTDAFPGMGANCANCHSGGSSGTVESRDASGTARTAFTVAPSGTVTIVLAAQNIPDGGAFAGLIMGSSFGIVESFTGAKNSASPGTLYVVNADENDLDGSGGTVKASIALTVKSTAAEGDYPCTAMLGYSGPQGISQSSPVVITVAVPPSDTPPLIGAVEYPVSVPVNAFIPIKVPITDDGGVNSTLLYYKGTGQTQYSTMNMTVASGDRKNGTWEARIPGQDSPGTVFFKINATDGKFFSASPTGPAANDYEVQVLAPGAPEISHQPVRTAYIGSAIAVDAVVSDAGTGVVMFYREVGASAYLSVPMITTGGGGAGPSNFTAVIPAQARKGSVSYYINATNGTRGVSTPEYVIDVLSLWEPELEHVPVTSIYAGFETALVANATNTASVVLWYKGVGQPGFSAVTMTMSGAGANGSTTFIGSLPAQHAAGAVSYYLNATNGTQFNSTKEFQIQVAEAIDLVLVDVLFSDRSPASHEEVILKARIWNNSTRSLSGVQVSFLDDYYPPGNARYIGLVSNLTLPANTTIVVRAWWLPQVNGTHRIRVTADSTGVVDELNEHNNEILTPIDVGPAREEGFSLFPVSGRFWEIIWPVLAVAAGFLIGVAAYLSRRWPVS